MPHRFATSVAAPLFGVAVSAGDAGAAVYGPTPYLQSADSPLSRLPVFPVVPEPSTCMLFGVGFAGVVLARRRGARSTSCNNHLAPPG